MIYHPSGCPRTVIGPVNVGEAADTDDSTSGEGKREKRKENANAKSTSTSIDNDHKTQGSMSVSTMHAITNLGAMTLSF
jgi:hypothetical protein